jgi:hypothetical protein
MAQARTDIGFQGGQVLALRIEEDAVDKLIAALRDDGASRWHDVVSEDESIQIDLAQVVYVRRETGNRTVGF